VRKTVYQIMRYGLTTLVSYVFLFGLMFTMVDILKQNEQLAYIFSLTITYIGVYFASAIFVFKTKARNKKTIRKFIGIIIFFWILNILFFYVLEELLKVHYLLAVFLNLITLGIFRFLINRYYVFRTNDT